MRRPLSLLLVFTVASVVGAQEPQTWSAATIDWQEINPDGTKYAVLEGRRDVPGEAFTYAFFIPANY
jgi:hypothetical protein